MLAVMMATESERSSPSVPERPSSRAWWVRRMAVRKIDRKVSVSATASIASSTAGRKARACWLPLLTSCSVRRNDSCRRTAGEFSSSTARWLKLSLS